MKTERVSYDIITPSAARGILEAIYWHPGMRWIVDKITVCEPIRFTNIRRNEVKSTILASKVRTAMEKGGGELYISTSDDIQQRAAMVLRNVRYVIDAHFEMTEKAAPSDNTGKFQETVKRRIAKGQCYHMPYFGCREFAVNYKMCEESPACPDELRGTRDLGYMLWDMDYYTDPENIQPLFFRAILRDGVLTVPKRNSGEVIG
jgi:CRISPR-associated protein Cas5d